MKTYRHILRWFVVAWLAMPSCLPNASGGQNLAARTGGSQANTSRSKPAMAEKSQTIPWTQMIPLLLTVANNGLLEFNNAMFQATVTGPAGSNVVVQASTNLHTWIPLVTNPLGFGSFTFTDMLTTNYPKRFYRAFLSP